MQRVANPIKSAARGDKPGRVVVYQPPKQVESRNPSPWLGLAFERSMRPMQSGSTVETICATNCANLDVTILPRLFQAKYGSLGRSDHCD